MTSKAAGAMPHEAPPHSGKTVILSDLVLVWELASVTWTVKELAQSPVGALGVPEITPVLGASFRPSGKIPEAIDQVYGALPLVAVSVVL